MVSVRFLECTKGLQRARTGNQVRQELAAQTGCEQLWSRLGDVDAILAPAAPGAAPLGQGKTGAPHMSRPWQAMGLPVITLPGMQNDAGLPLGVQLIGRVRADGLLLQQALWVESLIAER